MARRGRKRRLETESLYWQLILSGMGMVKACQEAGIGPEDRLPVAGGERRPAARPAGGRRPVGALSVAAGTAADRGTAWSGPGFVGGRDYGLDPVRGLRDVEVLPVQLGNGALGLLLHPGTEVFAPVDAPGRVSVQNRKRGVCKSGDLELLVAEVGDELGRAAQGGDEPVQHVLGRYIALLDLRHPRH